MVGTSICKGVPEVRARCDKHNEQHHQLCVMQRNARARLLDRRVWMNSERDLGSYNRYTQPRGSAPHARMDNKQQQPGQPYQYYLSLFLSHAHSSSLTSFFLPPPQASALQLKPNNVAPTPRNMSLTIFS